MVAEAGEAWTSPVLVSAAAAAVEQHSGEQLAERGRMAVSVGREMSLLFEDQDDSGLKITYGIHQS